MLLCWGKWDLNNDFSFPSDNVEKGTYINYQAKFKGWDSLTIEDLLVAYRKAKADYFFENTFPTAINFAEHEKNLCSFSR